MTFVQVLPAAILWVVVLVRLAGLRFGWKPGILMAMVWVAAGTTLNIDGVYLAVDGWIGSRNILNLIVHILIGLGMTELSRLMVVATKAARARWWFLVLGGFALSIGQAALLLASDTTGSATNFTEVYGTLPLIAWYQSLFFVWMGVITAYTGVEAFRRDRTGETRLFRVGFDVIAASCLVACVAVLTKLYLVMLAATGSGGETATTVHGLYRLMIAMTLVGFAIGFALPASKRVRHGIAERKWRSRVIRQLSPVVQRLADTEAGMRAGPGTAPTRHSQSAQERIYSWLIFLGDVRMDTPTLLSASETALLDEIEEKIAPAGSLNPHIPAGS